jgi:membrane protein DedA with SNARE-associated domain
MSTSPAEPTQDPAPLPPLSTEQKRQMRVWGTALGLLVAASMAGSLSALYLVNRAPLLLIGLSPLARHLILVAPTVPLGAFLLVAVTRSVLSCFVSFRMGRAVGPFGWSWLEQSSPGMGQWARWVERMFERSSYAVVLLLPSGLVAAIAGISPMRTAVFLPIATAGILLRALLIAGLGQALLGPIQGLLDLIDRHWKEGTVALILIYTVLRWRKLRSGRATTPDSGIA